ncbi:MAG: hypothetical protein LBS31_02255, partial [Candidatus Adiutrix sp.]|nr:hypothetical protein [Candidatus Adiutrix sp.]
MRNFGLMLGAALLFAPSVCFAGNAGCVTELSGAIICPPPSGGLERDVKGRIVCGPGPCARDSRFKVKCSARPGGALAVDARGEIVCVGGCVEGDPSYCEIPVK